MTVSVELTKREVEVLRLIARGYSDKEISEKLKITPRNMKYIAQRLHLKLSSEWGSPRVSLVIWCYESGFVKPGVKE